MSPPIDDGVYFIVNVGTDTVLDLTNGSSESGTGVQGFHKRHLSDAWVPAQLWVVAQFGDNVGVYTIENTNSRTFLDLTGGNVASDTPIIGYQSTRNPNQHWSIHRASQAKDAYVIRNEASGTYVDLLDGNSADHTPVNGWAGQGADTTNKHQLWMFVRA